MHVLLDLNCPHTSNLLNRASDLHYFNSSRCWILLGNDLNTSLKLLDGKDINMDSNIKLLILDETRQKLYNIYDIQSPSLLRNGSLIVKALEKSQDANDSSIEYNLYGTQLIVGGMVSCFLCQIH